MIVPDFNATVARISKVKNSPKGNQYCFLIVIVTSKKGRGDVFNIYVPHEKVDQVQQLKQNQKVRLSTFLNGKEDLNDDYYSYELNLRLHNVTQVKE